MKGIIDVLYFAAVTIAMIGGAGYAIAANAGVVAFACMFCGILSIANYFGWINSPKYPK